MDANFALEGDELERGFVLTCQARPNTGSVSVDFDR
jgi:ring-1,2-phenylacetyl-CoA epoxidase subunit PaaE